MRTLFSGLLAVCLFVTQAATAQCVGSDDNTALDVAGLKTRLMVTALTCDANARYNAFVTKYKAELVSQDKALTEYFNRVHGRAAQAHRDDYVTQLANSESQSGIRQGTLFCALSLPIFDEVMALRNPGELRAYTAGKTVAQPIRVIACGGGDRPKPASAAPSSRHRGRR